MTTNTKKESKNLWKMIGPGLVTGASDDDPSGIATYSQAGALFGLQTLWAAIVTLPLMIVVLEMFARMSLVTSRGLAKNLLDHYPKWILYGVIMITLPAIVFNIAADLAGMGAVANLLFPQVHPLIFSFGFTLILIFCLVRFSYQKVANILKWLCLALGVYLIVPFLVKQDWSNVLYSTFIPEIEWSADYLYILVAIIGTTISPYLFFWQSSMSLEHQNHQNGCVDRISELKGMKIDIGFGMLISNVVMFFIILTCGSVLHPAGITQIETVEQAAEALKPLAGEWAKFLFALGVMGTGLLAIPVLAGSISYLMKDTFHWNGGIDCKWGEAKKFYLVMIGAILGGFLLNCFGLNPVKSLIFTAVAYGLTCPVLIGLILHMCNKKEIMGAKTNSVLSNIWGSLALILCAGAAIALVILLL